MRSGRAVMVRSWVRRMALAHPVTARSGTSPPVERGTRSLQMRLRTAGPWAETEAEGATGWTGRHRERQFSAGGTAVAQTIEDGIRLPLGGPVWTTCRGSPQAASPFLRPVSDFSRPTTARVVNQEEARRLRGPDVARVPGGVRRGAPAAPPHGPELVGPIPPISSSSSDPHLQCGTYLQPQTRLTRQRPVETLRSLAVLGTAPAPDIMGQFANRGFAPFPAG